MSKIIFFIVIFYQIVSWTTAMRCFVDPCCGFGMVFPSLVFLLKSSKPCTPHSVSLPSSSSFCSGLERGVEGTMRLWVEIRIFDWKQQWNKKINCNSNSTNNKADKKEVNVSHLIVHLVEPNNIWTATTLLDLEGNCSATPKRQEVVWNNFQVLAMSPSAYCKN